MDWLAIAQNDWEVYRDKERIRRFVEFGKITEIQYQGITGELY